MENKEYIRELLNRYMEGGSSLEEENILKEYFASEKIPQEFRSEAQWFKNAYAQKISEKDVQNLEVELSQWIDKQNQFNRKIRLRYWTLGIAACLAILLGTTFIFKNLNSVKTRDTYQDPQIAYLEAKKVLLYVSQTLNKGTDKLQTVSRIEEGSSEMSMFSTFGSGLKNLELITKYDESAKQ